MPKKRKPPVKRRKSAKKSTTKRKVTHVRKNKISKAVKISKNRSSGVRRKTSKKSKAVRNDQRGRTRRNGKSKLVAKVKTKVTGNKIRQSKRVARRSKPTLEISRPKSRKDQKIHFTFKGVRSIDKKIDLINNQSDKVLQQQFRRKKGEPPLGMVVTLTDRHGRSASDMSPSDMVINSKNTKEFLARFMNALKSNNIRFRERNHNLPKGSKPSKDNNYDDFNPDNAVTVTVKFIYARPDIED